MLVSLSNISTSIPYLPTWSTHLFDLNLNALQPEPELDPELFLSLA